MSIRLATPDEQIEDFRAYVARRKRTLSKLNAVDDEFIYGPVERQTRPVAHQDEERPQLKKIIFIDVINLDRQYAQGRIADQDWYIRERLLELFEIDQLFAEGAIGVDEFVMRRFSPN